MREESLKIDQNPEGFWLEAAKDIGGEFHLSKQGQNAGAFLYDYYHLRIFKDYQAINIELHSTFCKSPTINDEYYLSSLRIETELENQDEFYLYTWRKGVLEKIFSKKTKDPDYREFNKSIGYKTNRESEVALLFSKIEIQDLILEQEISVFNIQFVDKKLRIKYQTNQIVRDRTILISEYSKFIILIEGLLEFQLIKPMHVTNVHMI